jgi:pimeloyl-ACP methyl ester carboxylesterase
MPEIKLSQGTIQYRDEGTGSPVVLIHGLLVNGQVWDGVVSGLRGRARCIVPDLPLGSHTMPMNADADLAPPALADLIAELIDRLELGKVTLVGSDTGGALCQLVVARHPELIDKLVLTNCDAFENFPPASFAFALNAIKRVPGALNALAAFGRFRFGRAGAMKAMPLTLKPIPDELVKSWVEPLRQSDIRRDTMKVVRGISPEQTLAAAEQLRSFPGQALIIWGERDKFFPFSDAERLAVTLPHARLERIKDARAFVQLDAPETVADLVASMAGGTPAPGASAVASEAR